MMTHKQALSVAERVIQEYEAKLRKIAEGYVYLPWYKRLWRALTRRKP